MKMTEKLSLCRNCHCMTNEIINDSGLLFCGKCQAFKGELDNAFHKNDKKKR